MPIDTEKAIAKVRKMAADRLEACAIFLVNKCRENLSQPGRTSTVVTISRGKNKGQSKTKWGPLNSAASKPGEFPRKQTGKLRSSVAYTIDRENLTARVGTSLKVGRWMEFGVKGGKVITPKNKRVLADAAGNIYGKKVIQGAIAPRPWLLKTLKESRGQLQQILTHGKTFTTK